MRVAAVQYRPPKGAPDTARRELVSWANRAVDSGATLIVFPEMATAGYTWPDADAIRPHAEPAEGATAAALGAVARDAGAWIVVGFPERDGDALFNSALVLGPDGAVLGCYRKMLLFDPDLTWATPGHERQLYAMAGARLVPGICMDLNDDRFVSHLVSSRADIAAFCTNWLDEGHDVLPYWRWRLRAFGGSFIAANSWGEDGPLSFVGASCILGPGGVELARAPSSGDALLVADVPEGPDQPS